MSSRYDRETRAKAVRLVKDHVGDYDSEWAAICAVSTRLGMSATTESAQQIRELKRKNAELERTIEIRRRRRVSSCGRATRYARDLRIHYRAEGPVRGRSDLPGVVCARRADRPADLLRPHVAAAECAGVWDTVISEVLAGIYEPDEHGRRPPECLYGSLKMWAHLQRQGVSVARCRWNG